MDENIDNLSQISNFNFVPPESPPNGLVRRSRNRSSSISSLFEDNIKVELPACVQSVRPFHPRPSSPLSPASSTTAINQPVDDLHDALGAASPLHSTILQLYLAHVALERVRPPAPAPSPLVRGGSEGTPTHWELTEAARRLESELVLRQGGAMARGHLAPPGGGIDLAKMYPSEVDSPSMAQNNFYSLSEQGSQRRRKNRESNAMAPVSF